MLKPLNFTKVLVILSFVSLTSLPLFTLPNLALADESDSRMGLPSRREGGATRGGTCNFKNPIISVIPKNSVTTTTSDSPTLFFYLPPGVGTKNVNFTLKNPNQELVYTNSFATPAESGIVSVTIPKAELSESLADNLDYSWTFALVCNPIQRSQDIVVKGFLRKVSFDGELAQKIETVSPIEQVQMYQKLGIWENALTTLVAMMKVNPNNKEVLEIWDQLLVSVDLDSLKEVPIIASTN